MEKKSKQILDQLKKTWRNNWLLVDRGPRLHIIKTTQILDQLKIIDYYKKSHKYKGNKHKYF